VSFTEIKLSVCCLSVVSICIFIQPPPPTADSLYKNVRCEAFPRHHAACGRSICTLHGGALFLCHSLLAATSSCVVRHVLDQSLDSTQSGHSLSWTFSPNNPPWLPLLKHKNMLILSIRRAKCLIRGGGVIPRPSFWHRCKKRSRKNFKMSKTLKTWQE